MTPSWSGSIIMGIGWPMMQVWIMRNLHMCIIFLFFNGFHFTGSKLFDHLMRWFFFT
jgi:hypothetical protein